MRLIDADVLILHLNDWALSVSNNDKEYEDVQEFIKCVEEFPSANQWIPCIERLPEVGQSVLMSVGGMYAAEGCLREDGNWAQFRWEAVQRKDTVDAWMPLPQYESEENDD